jgi:hypothetical protein
MRTTNGEVARVVTIENENGSADANFDEIDWLKLNMQD